MIQKIKTHFKRKKLKITKKSHAFKGLASSYNVEILNSLGPELQLKDSESAIRSKQQKFLFELKGFKFGVTLGLVLKI